MDLYVVVDTKGAGRLVGVFDDAVRADAVARINPNYFKVARCALNRINTDVLRWSLSDREHELLTTLIGQA